MTTLPENIIEKLIQIEAGIYYFESPKPGQMPFVVIERESPFILSAPTWRHDLPKQPYGKMA